MLAISRMFTHLKVQIIWMIKAVVYTWFTGQVRLNSAVMKCEYYCRMARIGSQCYNLPIFVCNIQLHFCLYLWNKYVGCGIFKYCSN